MRAPVLHRRVWWVLFLGASCALLACGLGFAPGDFSEPTTTDAGSTNDSLAPEASGLPSDAAAEAGPAFARRVLAVAGRRPSAPGESNPAYVAEVTRISFDATGAIVDSTFDVGPPVAAGFVSALVLDKDLLVQRDVNTVFRVAAAVPIQSEWSSLALRGSNPETGMRGWLTDGGLLSAGGFAGNNPTPNVYRAPFNFGDGGVDPWSSISASKLVKARAGVTLFRRGDFLYAIGGYETTSSTSAGKEHVEVTTIGADGTPGMFEATEPLTNPTTMAPHGVVFPAVASGHDTLFVVGGQATASSSGTYTDVVLASKIDPTTGKLGAWTMGPKLPKPTGVTTALVVGDQLVVFGGATGSNELSSTILSVPIGADGSLGVEWKAIGALPGPRSVLVALEVP